MKQWLTLLLSYALTSVGNSKLRQTLYITSRMNFYIISLLGLGSSYAKALSVNLGTSAKYTILSKAGVTNVPGSRIVGNLATSPIAAGALTGFSLVADASNVFSTSAEVTGKIYAADYSNPTPTVLTTAIGDMQTAYVDCAGRSPDYIELAVGRLGGLTLTPGVYKWSTSVLIASNLYLSGNASDIYIFQIAQDVTVSSAVQITLLGGLVPMNIFWQVAGAVMVGTINFKGLFCA